MLLACFYLIYLYVFFLISLEVFKIPTHLCLYLFEEKIQIFLTVKNNSFDIKKSVLENAANATVIVEPSY